MKISTELKRKYNNTYYNKNKKEIDFKKYLYRKTRDFGLYIKYNNIKMRCLYKSHRSYHDYGGRGINILWKSYKDFKNDMFNSYKKHLNKYGHKQTTIDRIDVNGNYCKDNCKWSTLIEQRNNRRK
jgi:hypothetical protein